MGFINKKNLIFFSVILYLIIFYITYEVKPAFLFNDDGSIKLFGLGYINKTIMPVWLFTVIIAIFSYLTIFYITRVNIMF